MYHYGPAIFVISVRADTMPVSCIRTMSEYYPGHVKHNKPIVLEWQLLPDIEINHLLSKKKFFNEI